MPLIITCLFQIIKEKSLIFEKYHLYTEAKVCLAAEVVDLTKSVATQQAPSLFASIELIPAGPLCLPSLAARQRDSLTASISVWTVLNCLKWEENNLPIKLSWEGGREGLWYLLLSPPQYFYYLQWIILRSYSCHVLMFHLISILFWWWGGVRWNSYLLLTPLVMNTIMITGNNSTSIC